MGNDAGGNAGRCNRRGENSVAIVPVGKPIARAFETADGWSRCGDARTQASPRTHRSKAFERRIEIFGAPANVFGNGLVYRGVVAPVFRGGPCDSESVSPLQYIGVAAAANGSDAAWREIVADQVALHGKGFGQARRRSSD